MRVGRFRRGFRDLPIRRKILFLVGLSSLAAFVFAGIALIVIESTTFRPRLAREMISLTDLYKLTLQAPLTFDDPKSALENLETLRLRPEIELACVFREDGSLFVAYGWGASCPETLVSGQEALWFEGGRLKLVTAIHHHGEHLGRLYLENVMPPLYERLPQYGLMVGVVFLSLLLVGSLLLRSFGRHVTRPILDLSATAQRIRHKKDYTVRATSWGNDEIGGLTVAFNGMLDAIQNSQEALEASVRLRDDFLSIASHELRTPLTPLRLQLQVVKRVMSAPTLSAIPEAKAFPKIMKISDQQIDRLSRLVDNLLDVSRIRTGKLTLSMEKIDLAELVSDVVERYQPEFASSGCRVEVRPDAPVAGYWDRLRIEQALINLLINAVKFGAGKPIIVTIAAKKGRARLSVRDFGIGIAPEDQKRIFEPFERAVSMRHFGGMGLGLFITHQIVESHGGRIEIESRRGEGSTFSIELPLRKDGAG